jgi:hypothetical protein
MVKMAKGRGFRARQMKQLGYDGEAISRWVMAAEARASGRKAQCERGGPVTLKPYPPPPDPDIVDD